MAALLNSASKPVNSRDQQLCNKVQSLGKKTPLAEVREVYVLPAIVQNTQKWDNTCLSMQRALLERAHAIPSAEGKESLWAFWIIQISVTIS